MFHLNSSQNSFLVNPANFNDQLENEFNYVFKTKNENEFNIPSELPIVSYVGPNVNAVCLDEDTYRLCDTNFKQKFNYNLNLHSNNTFDRQYDASHVFATSTRFTTFDCIPLNQMNDTNITDTPYVCERSYGQYIHNYSDDWPVKSYLNLDRNRLENCFMWPKSNNPQVLYDSNPEYMGRNVVCEYGANVGEESQNIRSWNNFYEFNCSQSMQIDAKLVHYGKNINFNENGVCLSNFNNIDVETSTNRNEIHSNCNQTKPNGSQQPDFVFEDAYQSDIGLERTEPPISETTAEPLDLSVSSRAPIDLLEATTSSSMYHASNFKKYEILKTNPNNHIIPEGDDYVQLFQQVSTFEMCFLENKSTIARDHADSRCGIGFDAASLCVDDRRFETEHDVNEARKTENEILSMFPLHNRNYQRRH